MPRRPTRKRGVPRPPWYTSKLYPTEERYREELRRLRVNCQLRADKIHADTAAEAARLGCSIEEVGNVIQRGYYTVQNAAEKLDKKYGQYCYWLGERYRSDEFLLKLHEELKLLTSSSFAQIGARRMRRDFLDGQK
mgnify:CR=1 FL=1